MVVGLVEIASGSYPSAILKLYKISRFITDLYAGIMKYHAVQRMAT